MLKIDATPYYKKINSIVVNSKEPFEGSIVYSHHANLSLNEFYPSNNNLNDQRCKLVATLALSVERMVEIGVNAGHSAVLALTANHNLHYVGIDICHHTYTEVCADYLKTEFNDRFEFIVGNSAEVLDTWKPATEKTLWHIDGDHRPKSLAKDLSSVLSLATDKDLILVDDTEDLDLRNEVYKVLFANKARLVLDNKNQMVIALL